MFPSPIISKTVNNAPSVQIQKMVSSAGHVALLYGNGELYMSGSGAGYKLGNGSTTNSYGSWILSLTNVSNVWVGVNCSVALKKDGTWWHCGTRRNLGTDTGTNQSWTDVSTVFTISSTNVKDVQIGMSIIFVLLTTGDLYGTGINNNSYEMGVGTVGSYTKTTLLVSSVVQSVYIRQYSSYYISTSGVLYRCGDNTYGQLLQAASSTKVNTWTAFSSSGSTFIDLQLTVSSVAALYTNAGVNKLIFAGDTSNGAIGNGTTTASNNAGTVITSVQGSLSSAQNNGVGNNCFVHKGTGSTGLYTTGLNTSYNLGTGTNSVKYTYSSNSIGVPSVATSQITNICSMGSSNILFVYSNKLYVSGNSQFFVSGATNYTFNMYATPYS